MDYGQIAEKEHVSANIVRRSVERYDRRRAALTISELQANQIEILQSNAKEEQAAIRRALTATKRAMMMNEEGNSVEVEVVDHDVALRAFEANTERIMALTPKGGNQTQVNLGMNINNQNKVSVGSFDSYENHLKSVLERRASLGPVPVDAEFADVPDCRVTGGVPADLKEESADEEEEEEQEEE